MDATELGTALTTLSTQIGTYVTPVLAFLGVVLGIKIGFAWFSKIGSRGK